MSSNKLVGIYTVFKELLCHVMLLNQEQGLVISSTEFGIIDKDPTIASPMQN